MPAKTPNLRPLTAAALLGLFVIACPAGVGPMPQAPQEGAGLHYPQVPAEHRHLRLLLDNAFRYADPAQGIVDGPSGYPAEGWNQEPHQGLFLRSFTQLTAIGAWVELMANVAAGLADNPQVSREAALEALSRAVATLLADQADPTLAAKGLLVNFLALEGGRRQGPLAEGLERAQVLRAFGESQGPAIWSALVEKGWLQEEDGGRKAKIRRGPGFGAAHFDGPLAAFAQEPTRSAIMGLLDRRALTIVFGDNANLAAALARSVGALLHPEVRDEPRVAALRASIERFIAAQREGYAHLLDPRTGTFAFGWDASADRFMGWGDGHGGWVTGQMNYFINEFRGPWTFVVLRHGLPLGTIRNAGLKIKPYRDGDGTDRYALAAWEGSAFQLLGLSLFMQERASPGWWRSLEALVDIELDYSTRHGLPGLLSEAYSGKGTEYTGLIGIPDLAVTEHPLNIRSPSLYSLGVAYSIAPKRVEGFLAAHWPTISGLLTDHGPWEGWSQATGTIVRYQTTAHTLSLILGGLGTAQDNMRRYLEAHALLAPLHDLYRSGDRLDLLAGENRALPWSADGGAIEFARDGAGWRFAATLDGAGGIAFVLPEGRTASLSNGRLKLGYRSPSGLAQAAISFKRAKDDPLPPPTIPVEIFPRFERRPQGELEIVLPATPALSGIQEVVLTFGRPGERTPVDLSIGAFAFEPFAPEGDPAP